jgi:hypothetical protein
MRRMRAFLLDFVLAWGVGVGAKLFDLLVVARAWSASPPESLKLMPYGPHYPVNPGQFFLPTPIVILVSSLGALIAGWKRPGHRIWLLSSAALFVALFVFTMIVFWPMNGTLYRAGLAEGSAGSEADVVRLARRWLALDWLRLAVMTAGFISALRAISLPVPPGPGAPLPCYSKREF